MGGPDATARRRGLDVPTALVVLVGGLFVAGLRLGVDVANAAPWAEDATVFLAGAADGSSGLGPTFEPYNGYLHLLPRLLAAGARLVPFADVATYLVAVCALIQALVALLAAHVLRTLGAARWAAVLGAAPVVAVPVGLEVVLTVANLQWFLLYASLLVVLWSPAGRAGRVTAWFVLTLTALSSPFGLLAPALLLVRAAVTRSRAALRVALAAVPAVVVQLVAMRVAPARPVHPAVEPAVLGETYLRRVVADGMLGVWRNGTALDAPSIVAGVVCLGITLVILGFGVTAGGRRLLIPALVLVLLSLLAFAGPAVLEGVAGTNPSYQGRYVLAPALLWLVMVALALSWAADLPGGFGGVVRVLVTVAAAGLVVALALTYPARVGGRLDEPAWRPQAQAALDRCRTDPSGSVSVSVQVAPKGSSLTLTCAQVDAW